MPNTVAPQTPQYTPATAATVTTTMANTAIPSTLQTGMSSTYTIGNNGYINGGNITIAGNTYQGYATTIGSSFNPGNLFRLNGPAGEILHVTKTGEVIWANGINVDEAAEAFVRTIHTTMEIQSGITKKVKCEMRDSVFNELISIAQNKGALTADDLTFLLEASKIVEKLKGGRE